MGDLIDAPTASPTAPLPTAPIPPTSQPTQPPTNPPPDGICSINGDLNADATAGYSCQGGGGHGGDSNFGAIEGDCLEEGGDWLLYDCGTAEGVWLSYEEGDIKDALKEAWEPICCGDLPPTPAPDDGLCRGNTVLDEGALAGYACLVDGASIGDSNFGYIEVECAEIGGVWTPYDCATAASHFSSVEEYIDEFLAAWAPKCCAGSTPAPTANPIIAPPTPMFENCPSECMVPTCVWSGEDGPGWDPSWIGDGVDGRPTKNGFCTHHCKVYDEESGKALCGDGAWHQSGTDCTGCEAIASEILSPENRAPSTGLCAATESMSGLPSWGTGIKECEATENSCTVWQSMNGDSEINPQRTCRDFCSSFGLLCINGYDDGADGCTYGGEGIGCDSILGCCSEGGPTPGKLRISY